MNNNNFQDIGKVLESNLKKECCSKKITVIVLKYNNQTNSFVKLYDKICDACEENENFALYPLDRILKLNDKHHRPSGIVCRDCSQRNCKKEGCIVSLIIDDSKNTRFSRMDKMEIFI